MRKIGNRSAWDHDLSPVRVTTDSEVEMPAPKGQHAIRRVHQHDAYAARGIKRGAVRLAEDWIIEPDDADVFMRCRELCNLVHEHADPGFAEHLADERPVRPLIMIPHYTELSIWSFDLGQQLRELVDVAGPNTHEVSAEEYNIGPQSRDSCARGGEYANIRGGAGMKVRREHNT